jgi:hypothetical protein
MSNMSRMHDVEAPVAHDDSEAVNLRLAHES